MLRYLRTFYWKHEVAIRPVKLVAETLLLGILFSSPIWLTTIFENFN